MESSHAQTNINVDIARRSSWKPLLRQVFVCSGAIMNIFIFGVYFGAPTVYIPQIKKQANSTEGGMTVNMGMVSWLFSISSYGSLPWVIIYTIVAEKYGRKVPYIILWVNGIISVSLFYFSSSLVELMISGVLQGMFLALNISIGIMVLTEYTSPKYRGIIITFKGATLFWGMWFSNAIGTFFPWKNIGILIFICSLYTISPLFWPQSPVWLATKGRFEECAKSHRWLKGEDTDAEEELKELIFTQKENLRKKRERQIEHKNFIIKNYHLITAKRFYKPLICCVITTLLYHFSGKLACTGYILDIIKTITASESTAYEGMLVLDGVTVLGMYIGVFLSKFLKRRTLFLGSASIGVMFLFVLSAYLYLIHLNVISEHKYLTLFLLIGFSLTISCGPMLMCICLASEMTPIKCRSLFLCLFTLTNNLVMGCILKMFPYVLKYFAAHGAFLFYAVMSSIFIYILYKVLPETKDKTIIEIERYFLDKNDVFKKEEEKFMNSENVHVK